MAAKLGAVQGSVIMVAGWRPGAKSVRLGLSACADTLPVRMRTDGQGLRRDDHARDMAFDQVALRHVGRSLFPHR